MTLGYRRVKEAAALCHMSTDYYARLERGTGLQRSEKMIASIAQGLHLSLNERSRVSPVRSQPTCARHDEQLHRPRPLRILDRLDDTPAQIVTELGETLPQSRMGVALTGDASRFSGPDRSLGYRCFTDSTATEPYPPEERALLSRVYIAGLREIVTLVGRVRVPNSSLAA